MSRVVVGVMGPGEGDTSSEQDTAFALGQAIAQQGWVLLTGGRGAGVMEAASQGARSQGGLVIGIWPGDTPVGMSSAVDIPILTGLGQARNVINVLSSRVVIACGLGAGTLSEIALALKLGRPVVLMGVSSTLVETLQPVTEQPLTVAESVAVEIAQVQHVLQSKNWLEHGVQG